MCMAKSPTPQAPPAPIPERDNVIDSRRGRQTAAAAAAQSGAQSTMLSDASGPAANVASPVLGG